MKEFQCNVCNYSTNYKHDLKRHRKAKHPHNQDNDNQVLNTTPGGGVQALNLANNINVPHQPGQVININSPHTPNSNSFQSTSKNSNQQDIDNKSTRKRPINLSSNNSEDRFDIRLKDTFKIFICGPSGCGKTTLIKQFLKNLSVFTKSPPKTVVLVYKVWQPDYDDMALDFVIEDAPDMISKVNSKATGQHMLVIFDDLINSDSLDKIGHMFAVDGRHKNMSLIFLSQKYFGKEFLLINGNIDYSIMFKNPINASEIRTLASRMTPGKRELVDYYNKATEQPFSYLFINLTQQCKPQTKFLSHLFDIPHVVRAYYNNSIKGLHDNHQTSYTDYSNMIMTNEVDSLIPINSDTSNDEELLSQLNNLPPPEAHEPYDAEIENRLLDLQTPLQPNSIGPSNQTTGVVTEPTHYSSIGVGPDIQAVGTVTDPVHYANIGIGPYTRTVGTLTDPLRYNSVGVGPGTQTRGTSTDPVQYSNVGVGPEYKTKGTETIPVYKSNVGIGLETKQATTSTTPIIYKNTGVGPEGSISTSTSPDSIQYNNNQIVEMEEDDDDDDFASWVPTYEDYHELAGLPAPANHLPIENHEYRPIVNQPQPLPAIEGPTYQDYHELAGLPAPTNHLPIESQTQQLPAVEGETATIAAIEDQTNAVQAIEHQSDNIPAIENQASYEDYFQLAGIRPLESLRQPRNIRINQPLFDVVRAPMRLTRRPASASDQVNSSRLRTVVQDDVPAIINNYMDHKCKVCNDTFVTKRALQTHMKVCSVTSYSCSFCGQNLPTRRALTGHLNAMHASRIISDNKTKLANKHRHPK